MKKHSITLHPLLLALLLVLAACQDNPRKALPADATPVPLTYATHLTLHTTPGYSIATVRNPWDTLQTLHTYILVPRASELPANLPQGTVIRTPLQRAIVYSSVHCSLLQQLGAVERIAGVCDLSYMLLPQIQEGHRAGRIADLGNGMAPDVEKMIDLHADAILLSPFENSGYGQVEKIGVPLVECADYMEQSPLARAEWMRFYGMLFGCEAAADSLFQVVETTYNSLRQQATQTAVHPQLLSELKNGSAWYVPGGRSTMGILYADAGARYLWADDTHSGSLPLAAETVIERGEAADIWLVKYHQQQDKTLGALAAEYAPYTRFRAFKQKCVYGCNTATTPFYEETPFHPEWLLEDLIRIIHPQLLPQGELRYYKLLKE